MSAMPSSSLPAIIDNIGETRRLGRLPLDASGLQRRMALPSYGAYLQSIGSSLIPEGDWVDVENDAVLDDRFLTDQDGQGACTFASCTLATEMLRVARGQPFVKLSWAFGYDQYNRGDDNGTNILDSLKLIRDVGLPLFEDYPAKSVFNTKIQPASKDRFKEEMPLPFMTWEEGCDILQRGGFTQSAVQVGANYNRFDKNGCCGVDAGSGNHSIMCYGIKKIDGVWYWKHRGTWGRWGPFKNGCALFRRAHFDGCGRGQEGYGHLVAKEDPLDKETPA